MSFQKICKLDDIVDGTARGFDIIISEESFSIICVRQGQHVFAYKNSCPHTGINLEWQPDQFLDDTQQFIVCSTHGALFQLEDGYCVSGPCAGDSLSVYPVKQEQGDIFIDVVDAAKVVSR